MKHESDIPNFEQVPGPEALEIAAEALRVEAEGMPVIIVKTDDEVPSVLPTRKRK